MASEKTLSNVKQHDKLNSMLYWYPKIAENVPTPKTLFIDVDQVKIFEAMDGKPDKEYIARVIQGVKNAVKLVGGPPAFLRTDQCAGKHEWDNTCYVIDLEHVVGNICGVAEANECAGIMGLRYKAFAVREFLKLEAPFKAFLGMPIAREFRFFSQHGEILCHHPYWPEEAIRFYHNTLEPKDWRERLSELQKEPDDFETARILAQKVTEWSNLAWSVDVCRTENKQWFVTDMALAEDSYHWESCSKKVN